MYWLDRRICLRWAIGGTFAALTLLVTWSSAMGQSSSTPSPAVSPSAADQVAKIMQRSQPAAPRAPYSASELEGMSSEQALGAAARVDPGLFAEQQTRLLEPPGGQRVAKYLDEFSARLDVPGRESDVLVQSDVPLQVERGAKKVPVDLDVVGRDGGYEPQAPLVDVHFPDRLVDGIDLGHGVRMRLVGASPGAQARVRGQQTFYGNALGSDAAIDVHIMPLPRGTESFMQVRKRGPVRLEWTFDLPAGARMAAVPGGGAEVRTEKELLLRVLPPVAKDATGEPVAVSASVDGSRLTLTADVSERAVLPVLIDPVVENMFAGGDANNPNNGFSDVRGWKRESNVAVSQFTFTPAGEGDAGGSCTRINAQNNALVTIAPALCVTTRSNVNYGLLSLGQWAWRPPAGIRGSASDLPEPNVDAYIYRADVRHSYLYFSGASRPFAGLLSGRTRSYIGVHGPPNGFNVPDDQTARVNGGPGGANPWGLPNGQAGNASNSSFFRTYCITSDCREGHSDPNVDGTSFNFGISAASTGAASSSIVQGAILSISDRTPPTIAHTANFDQTLWRSSGTLTSTVTGADRGVGVERVGIIAATGSQVFPQSNRCTGTRLRACGALMANTFSFDTQGLPEGANQVAGSTLDALGKQAAANITVKVDRTAPQFSSFGGPLAAKENRAATDGTYDLSASFTDGANRSGVKTITFKRADTGATIASSPIACAGNDCPASASSTASIDTATLPAGTQTINVTATDSANLTSATKQFTFVVDHAPPTITGVTHAPSLNGWLGVTTVTSTVSATDDGSGVQRFRLTTPTAGGSTASADVVIAGCDDRIASACPRSVSRPLTYETGAMGDGAARPVSATATDALGQTSAPRQWQVDVDTAGPQVTLSGEAWDMRGGLVGSADLGLRVQADDRASGQQRSGVKSLAVQVGSGTPETFTRTCTTTATEPCTLDRTFTVRPSELATGSHTIKVTATDQAAPENVTTQTFVLFVDKTAPTINALGVQHDPSPVARWRDDVPRSVTVPAHDDDSGVRRVEVRVPTAPAPTTKSAPSTCSVPVSAPCPKDVNPTIAYATTEFGAQVPEGQHPASLIAVDAAENPSAPLSFDLRIDRTPPTAQFSGSLTEFTGQVLVGGSSDVRVDAADGSSGVKLIRFLVDGVEKERRQGECTAEACANALSATFSVASNQYPAGQHTATVEVSDFVGTPAERHVISEQFPFTNLPVAVPDDGAQQGTLGFEGWQTYDDHPTGAGSSAHVNLTSGNALWTHTFLSNPGRGIDTVGRLTYNSHEPRLLNGLPLLGGLPVVSALPSTDYNQTGRGFSLGLTGVTRLNQPLDLGVTNGLLGALTPPTRVVMTDGDGTRHTFVSQGNGIYQGPPGVYLRFKAFSSGDETRAFAMTAPDGRTYFFDRTGYLTSIADRVGNVMTFTYQSITGLGMLQDRAMTQCGAPLVAVGCTKRVIEIKDATGVADNAPNRSVRIAYSATGGSRGLIDSISDHGGRITKFGYDAQRRLASLTEAQGTPAQRVFTLGYEGETGYLTSVVDPRNNTTALAHEAAGLVPTALRRLTAVNDRHPTRASTSYAYGQSTVDGTAVSSTAVTDPKGRVEQVRTDSRQRMVELVDARGKIDRWTWDDAVNKSTRYTQAKGTADEATNKWEWGALGQLEKAFWPFKSDNEGDARTTDYVYRLSSAGPLQGQDSSQAVVYDLTETVPPKGEDFKTIHDPDAQGRVMSICEPTSPPQTVRPCLRYTYAVGGVIKTVTDQQSRTVTYDAFDASGLPREKIDKRGNKWQSRYDDIGNLLAVRDPRGASVAASADLAEGTPYTARYTYDALDRRTAESVPKRSAQGSFISRSFAYDSNDNRTQTIDGESQVWGTSFTHTDRVERERSPAVSHHGETSPAAEETRLEYDDTDQVMVLRRPLSQDGSDNFLTRYTYDDVDQRVVQRQVSGEALPAGGQRQLVTSWAYDLRGNQVGMTDPRLNLEVSDEAATANAAAPAKQRMAWTYDEADRKLTQVDDPDGLKLTTTWSYDVHDNLETATAPRGNDSAESNDGDFKTRYDYDRRDLRTTQTDPLGRRTEWRYRPDGQVSQIVSPKGTGTSNPDDFTTTLEYDEHGDLQSRELPRATENQYGGTLKVSYARNQVGDPETVTDARGNSITNTFLDTGQLATTTRPSWWIYDEDGAGVRERTEADPLPGSGGRDLPSDTGNGDFGKTEPQLAPDVLPRAGMTTLGYDQELRLSSVRDAAGTTQTFGYDGTGRLVRRDIPYTDPVGPNPRANCRPGVESEEVKQGPITTTWSYDRNGNQRTTRDGRCQQTDNLYDQFDRLVRVESPANWDGTRAVSEQALDRNGNVLVQSLPRDPARAMERMSYDAVDRVESKLEPFDSDEGSPRSEWRYRYDAHGNQTAVIRPRSQDPGAADDEFTTRTTFDEADQIQEVRNGDGEITSYDYDFNGNQVRTSEPGSASEPGATVQRRVIERTFDGRDKQWTETTGTGEHARTAVSEYDGNGNLRREVHPRGVGSNGLPNNEAALEAPITASNQDGEHAEVRVYDADNLQTVRHLPFDTADGGDRWRQTTIYNDRGWPESVSQVYNATENGDDGGAGVRNTYLYYPTGWVRQSTDKGSSDPQTLLYEYDLSGNQTRWSSPGRTRRIEREFLPNSQLETRRAVRTDRGGNEVAGETRTYDYERNAAGELTKLIDRNAPRPNGDGTGVRTTSIGRDVAGRIRTVNELWEQGRDTVYRYQTGGLIDEVSVDGSIQRDADGKITGYGGGRVMAHRYDNLDREDRTTVREPGASPASERERLTSYEYWPSDEQRSVTKTNETVEERYFSDDGRPSLRRVEPGQDGDTREHEYRHDANGNRSKDERGTYTHNARDQLTKWEHPGGGENGAGTEKDPKRTVTYETAGDGRLMSKEETAVAPSDGLLVTTKSTTKNTYDGERLDSATQSSTATAPGAEPSTQNSSLKYDYDLFGSMLTVKTRKGSASEFKTTTQYTYDSFQRLLSSRDDQDKDGEADGDHTVYCYDALDRRDRRVIGVDQVDDDDSFARQRTACRTAASDDTLDYTYLGLGEHLTREATSGSMAMGPRTYDYTAEGARLGQRAKAASGDSDARFRPYETDAQGSTVAVEDPDAAGSAPEAEDRYLLDPYGDALNEEKDLSGAAKANPFRYQGHYFDQAAKTYDMQARSYRPSIGRFLSQDRFEDPAADLALQQDPLTNNRYSFLGGGPVTGAEFDGHCGGAFKFIRSFGIGKKACGVAAGTIRVAAGGVRLVASGGKWLVANGPRTLANGVTLVYKAGKLVRTLQPGDLLKAFENKVVKPVVRAAGKAKDAAGSAVKATGRAAAGVAKAAVKVAPKIAVVLAAPPPFQAFAALASATSLNTALDVTQTVLDVAGQVPVLGEAADLSSGVISLARGDYTGALLSLGAAVPVLGNVAGGAKLARRGKELLSKVKTKGGGCSFSGQTVVLMADGSLRAISEVLPGDFVVATDPATGRSSRRQVTNTWLHMDRMVVLRLTGSSLQTTEDHPFWNETDGEWQRADRLDAGDRVRTADGRAVRVLGVQRGSGVGGFAYNLTVRGVHTYHVGAGRVLVHNAGGQYCDLKSQQGVTDRHHMPADSVSPVSRGKGPAIEMDKADHARTASYGRGANADAYRAEQKRLIDEGRFDDAFLMDVDDVQSKFGSKYDQSILDAMDGLPDPPGR